MIDARTKTPVRVLIEGDAPPFIEIEFGPELDAVRRVLDENGIKYGVDPNVISFNGGPGMTFINFRRKADAFSFQKILDAAF